METRTEKGRTDEYPEKENSNTAAAFIQARIRESANCLFSPSETMFKLEVNSLGLEGACRMFFIVDPLISDYTEVVQHLPTGLRQLRSIGTHSKSKIVNGQTVTEVNRND